MDRSKIVNAAREKIREKNQSEANEKKSFVDDVIGAVMGIVGDDSDDDKSARTGGKFSGKKPQARNEGRVATVGRNIADQLKGKK